MDLEGRGGSGHGFFGEQNFYCYIYASHDVTGNVYHVRSALCSASAQLQSKAFITVLVNALYVSSGL